MADPVDLHARALDLLMRGDTAGGITDLKAHLAAEPDDAAAWTELGAAYAAIAHWSEAAHAFRAAVDLDGEDVDARLGAARALVQLGKLDDAAFQLLQAARQDPPDPRALRELGVVFYDKRLHDKAVHWLTKAVAAAPGDARAHYALGLAHEAKKDMGAAVAAYREAIRHDPGFADAYRTLADTLASMGEHEGAVGALEALLAIEKHNEQAAQNRDVLLRALEAMHQSRLLGKGERELEASALIGEGGFRKKGVIEGSTTVRYTAPLMELWATYEEGGALGSLLLMLTDPATASRTEDDTFKVTVVTKDGRREPADFGTAASLTFLREALGCPMTHASELYARLLGGDPEVTWGGAVLRFDSVPRPDRPTDRRHGLRASLA
jgi:tetratricopeptide (TPR) repeat protein